ncbi:MAG: hypothetical protein J6Y64_08860 [Ruminococcus sp.]|nr:hypothetical protein [Ruminococcus sp.]
MNRLLRRFAAGAFALIMGAQACMGAASAFAAGNSASAETAAAMARDYYTIDSVGGEIPSFSEYYELHSDKPVAEREILISTADYETAENGDITVGSFTDDSGESRDGVLLWNSPDGEAAYEFYAAESGKYCIEVSYCPMISASSDIELKMEVDGSLRYETASRLKLNRTWVYEREI